ncbi:MAG: T9SS type A sorting domain-containing protein [Bacteroidia bacterium]|nr:T9SS type A sorting domain-containing protein [Bacteroidia bacterium]
MERNYGIFEGKEEDLGGKLGPAGALKWFHVYGDTLDDEFRHFVQTSDGGALNGGGTLSFGAANQDAWTVKTDHPGFTACHDSVFTTPQYYHDSILSWSPSAVKYSINIDTFDLAVDTLDADTIICGDTIPGYHKRSGYFTQEDLAAGFSVYPNPFRNELNIQVDAERPAQTFRIFDLRGKLWRQVEAGKTTTTTISMSDLPAGVYFILVDFGDENIARKLIKLE